MRSRGLCLLAAAISSTACNDEGATDNVTYSRERLLKPETCAECHQTHYEEWSGSMHAYAAEDPVFRAMNARGQEETGGELGDFCVNCHAPLAVQEGATTDGLNLDEVDKHLQGVTCYFCHQVEEVAGSHNSPLVLANDTTMRGGVSKPVKTKAHRSQYSRLHDGTALESSPLCGSCHDIVVPRHFSGASEDVHLERTFAEWKGSVFADPDSSTQPQSCSTCHMVPTPNTTIANPPSSAVTMPANRSRHSHMFPGVDVALTDFPQREEQHKAVSDSLEETLRMSMCWSPIEKTIRVELQNVAAGHFFPSGAAPDRRAWVEVKAYLPGSEEPVFTSGSAAAGVPVTSLVPLPDILRDVTTKLDGSVAHMFWDVAGIEPNVVTVAAPSDDGHTPKFIVLRDPTPGGRDPSRITATLWVEPIGLDVLDDLVESNHLARSVREAMPRFQVLPNRYGQPLPGEDATVSLEWTPDSPRRIRGLSGFDICVETAAERPRFDVPDP